MGSEETEREQGDLLIIDIVYCFARKLFCRIQNLTLDRFSRFREEMAMKIGLTEARIQVRKNRHKHTQDSRDRDIDFCEEKKLSFDPPTPDASCEICDSVLCVQKCCSVSVFRFRPLHTHTEGEV